jgi:vitamin B12 transporter
MTEDISPSFPAPGADRRSRLLSRNKRRNVNGSLTATLPRAATLSAGAEYVDESERSVNSEGSLSGPLTEGPGFAARRDIRAVYAELNGEAARATYLLSVRRDDHSDYDAHTTYRVGTSASLTAATRVRATMSTAFNAPAFNQLRATLFTVGSPDLRPEHSRAWEVGFEHRAGRGLRVSAAYFNQRFMDMIQFVSGGPPDFLGSYDNLTEATSNGYEIEIALAPGGEWSAAASFTQTNPRVARVSSGYAGDLRPGDALIRRPKHTASGTVSWGRAAAGAVSLTATYVGERPDFDFTQFPSPVVILSRYAKLDVAGSRDLISFAAARAVLSATARVENLLDGRHQDVYNFRSPGRIIVIGARVRSSM